MESMKNSRPLSKDQTKMGDSNVTLRRNSEILDETFPDKIIRTIPLVS